MQIYCAFQYNTQGFCTPPMFISQDGINTRTFNLRSLPVPSNHFDMKKYKQFFSQHHEKLIPARLAILILVHKDVPAVLELLHSIYRSQHFYVIHIDSRADETRKELNKMLSNGFFTLSNVVVLPIDRSFPTSWASYDIVRAELEGFEELLRMGTWDFAINLSGSDLPLRDIDDLALGLAPHRGSCFFPFVHLINDKNNNSSDSLEKAAYYACDGYVYNVTLTSGLPDKDEIGIYRSPQWGVFSRDFVEYLLDERLRSPVINKFQFYLQTHVVPDESYIPTILMNSPFRNSLQFASIQTSKEFQGTNADDICRHVLSDSDFCGQGPGYFSEEDIPTLLSHSHRSFFSRKFHTGQIDGIRKFVIDLSETGYYQFFETFLPRAVLKVLAESSIAHHASSIGLVDKKKLVLESVRRLYVTPSFSPHDSCCRSKIIAGIRKVTDYSYWMDISIMDKVNRSSISARLMLEPTINGRYCYPDGDLKMVFISPWLIDNKSKTDSQSYGLDQTLPLPYGPAFTHGVSVILLLSRDTENENCRGNFFGDPLIFTDIFKPIVVSLELISPDGNSRCSRRETVYFQDSSLNETISSEDDHQDEKEEPLTKTHNFVMRCEKMEPGPWKLQMMKVGSLQERIYNFPFYLLDYTNQEKLNLQLQDVEYLWELKDFEILSDETLNFIDEFTEQEQYIDQSEIHATFSYRSFDNCQTSFSCNAAQRWFVCSGGIVTCTLILIFLYQMFVGRIIQIQQKFIMYYIMILVFVTAFQLLLFMFYC